MNNTLIHPMREHTYNPQWAGLLEQALVYLWDGEVPKLGRHHNICGAVIEVGVAPRGADLANEITKRLLRAEACVYFSTFYSSVVNANATEKEIQAARRAWMLDMIEEFRDEQNKQ